MQSEMPSITFFVEVDDKILMEFIYLKDLKKINILDEKFIIGLQLKIVMLDKAQIEITYSNC